MTTMWIRIRDWWLTRWQVGSWRGKAVLVVAPLLLGCCALTMISALVSPPDGEPTADVAERAAVTVEVEEAEETAAATDVPPSVEPVTATPRPSATPRATATNAPAVPTPTEEPTAELLQPTQALFAQTGELDIVELNATEGYVDIQNVAGADVMLTGWAIRFGELEACSLDGVGLFPDGYRLRVWVADRPPTPEEYSCGLDAGALSDGAMVLLFDPTGQEIDRRDIEGVSRVVQATAVPPTEPPAPPAPTAPPPAAPGNVVISSIRYDGDVPQVESDEYAVITNQGGSVVNLGNWRLNAGEPDQNFTFPSFDLQPGQSCRVYTNEAHPESCGFSFGRGDALWRNSNDCGYLYNAEGAEVSRFCWD